MENEKCDLLIVNYSLRPEPYVVAAPPETANCGDLIAFETGKGELIHGRVTDILARGCIRDGEYYHCVQKLSQIRKAERIYALRWQK